MLSKHEAAMARECSRTALLKQKLAKLSRSIKRIVIPSKARNLQFPPSLRHRRYGLLCGALKYFSMGISKYISSCPLPSRTPVR
jgi:hypothetical protein